ncbi:MAG: dTDP-4-dehydrorhamnose reductase [Acidobacteria bacterium]|nr:dTDP-4-dehydrorhamnose reductase [Acidobacteriota bacterium]
MTPTKITPLVTGGGGRLGLALQEAMADAYPAAVFATRDEIDVTDYFRLASELERIRPTVVINAASFTHVDGCEDEPERARLGNDFGAGNVARAAAQVDSRVIHVSTDLVFDGALARRYREDDAPAPLSVYGRTKLDGETAVAAESPGATILRAAWFFGEGAGRFPENFLSMIEAKRSLGLVADRYGSPTYIPDLAEAIVRLIAIPHAGILHFTNPGEITTRYHFVKRAADSLGLDTSAVRPLSHLEWKGDRAPRPMNSALDPSEFIRVTGFAPRTWEEAQDAFLRERALSGRPA